MERRPTERLTPLLLALSVYFLLWADLYLPRTSLDPFSTAWFALLAAKGVFRVAFLLYAMGRGAGFGAFGLGLARPFPTSGDMANAILVAASAGVVAVAAALAALFFGVSNPLVQPFAQASRGPLTIVLMFLSSLGVGYSEELYFRFFAPAEFERAGFAPVAAIIASAALFGLSHGSQGLFGMIGTGFLALIFSFFKMRGKGIHALALGHALYDFVVLLVLI